MKWKNISYDEEYIEKKKILFDKNEVITTLLLNRGIKTKEEAESLLDVNYKQLHDPFLLKNMKEVVDKLLEYMNSNKKVLIFGDYDIDGIFGSMYLSNILNKINIKNEIYIPERSIFKYYLSNDFFEKIKRENISLIISVDNSFGEKKEIDKLKNLGVDLVITDHHLNEKKIENVLEINPRRSLNYPFKELSGAGVVFKLAQAIYLKYDVSKIYEIYECSELVALATIADVMESIDENRFLIKRGLKNFSKTKILAFTIIMNNFKIDPKYITINDISYRISPLINAMGKLDDTNKILKFLTSNSEKEIFSILNEMYDFNIERKKYENIFFEKISNNIKKKYKNIRYIYYEVDNMNLAFLGSISSRLSNEFKVPVIVVAKEGKYCKASCRSLDDMNIYKVIKTYSKYFINFGGHDLAAGFLIENKNLDKIKSNLKKALEKLQKKEEKETEIIIDMELSPFELDSKLLKEISSLGPFGLSNSEPNFVSENIVLKNLEIFGLDDKHFKATISNSKNNIQVLGYNMAEKINLKKNDKSYKIIYTPELIKKKTIRIKIKDIK